MTNSSTNYGHASGDDVTTPPKQDKGNMQMVNTLTTDLVYQIFGYLSSRDLLRLGITCKDWCELVLDWPPFWKILDKELKLNPALHEYVINILRHQETVHLIETPAVPQFAKEYWLLLVEMLQRDTTILGKSFFLIYLFFFLLTKSDLFISSYIPFFI
ncbi:hypothetical protein BDA99DRAFT_63441 [Phascolomyces articulosus]|uniref:F-box domain-containing protein n=1 Tax=Phascolomyces articulosus TaxID=60185 RepID=A0AAD5PDZ8_9FUNG|nr:hypothetical protein BDA99DRAFT_63441 [Phascolomyces articulosus]